MDRDAMISDGSAVLSAGGRDWSFRLTVGQWMKLQQSFGGGPQKISGRFSGEDWRIEDVREIIERGLEGGGLSGNEARETATQIMDSQPLDTNYHLAIDVMGAAWTGLEEYLKKKAMVAAATIALSQIATGNGTGALSSEPDSSSDSSHPKPRRSASSNISP
jgi:hypothetical protein